MNANRSLRHAQKENNNKNSAPKRACLFGARFILAAIIIFVCTVLVFNNFIFNSSIWQLMLSTDRDSFETGDFADVLTKIEIDSKTDENGDPYYDIADFPSTITWGSVWAYITIEGTELVNSPVYCGDTDELLAKGVCKYYGSYFPGEGHGVVLNGHVMKEFYCLEDLPVGTKITLDTIYGEYVYEIYDTVIFSDDDKSYILEKTDEERLLMYTCYPRGYSYRAERYAVLCKKLSGVNFR